MPDHPDTYLTDGKWCMSMYAGSVRLPRKGFWFQAIGKGSITVIYQYPEHAWAVSITIGFSGGRTDASEVSSVILEFRGQPVGVQNFVYEYR